MKKGLQESVPNLGGFWVDFGDKMEPKLSQTQFCFVFVFILWLLASFLGVFRRAPPSIGLLFTALS